MTKLSLPPSEIRYTQESIGRTFGRCTNHAFKPIGETLDELLTGMCSVYSIPNISVIWKNGKYYSAENRRLWVFKKAEELGKCNKESYIPPFKWTTQNDGESLYVRGDPGGSCWKKFTPRLITNNINEIEENGIRDTIKRNCFTNAYSYNGNYSRNSEIENNLLTVATLDTEGRDILSISKYKKTDSPSAIVEMEMEPKTEDFSLPIQNSDSEMCNDINP
ncbi:hypothetical protein KUTeg_002979, partial [Tegillarca granosa]